MKWQIKHKLQEKTPGKRRQEIVRLILHNRGIESEAEREEFLRPVSPLSLTPAKVGIDKAQLDMAVSRIGKAIKSQQPIIVFGDYDADGVTATAILWETLHTLGAKVIPFIPEREKHGYGLSIQGIKDILKSRRFEGRSTKPLFITVDNGIVAHEAAAYLKREQIDLIITDHHLKSDKIPPCLTLVHTTQLAGVGVAWMVAKELLNDDPGSSFLDLVTIGTVADMLPLKGVNRSLVKYGLEALAKTKRKGLQALFEASGIEPSKISTYHLNFVIAPRINAMGRLEHALDSLRLLLTTNETRAQKLALLLNETNSVRQDLTKSFLEQALSMVGKTKEHVIVVEHQDFHEGVIGLIAGKLVETYYRPSIVIAKGKSISKGSVRSIAEINIIQYLRQFGDYYVNVGGHPMAAGFTIETNRIDQFKNAIQLDAMNNINDQLLIPKLTIDVEISIDDIGMDLYADLEQLRPFGMGNREPVFGLKQVRVIEARTVGKNNDHLKLTFQAMSGTRYQGIAFGFGQKQLPKVNSMVDIAFTLDQNTWNGSTKLQLMVKDVI